MAFVLKRSARPGAALTAAKPLLPLAPGAVTSPQIPGQVPDRSSVPGENQLPVPAAVDGVHRPISERGTSQVIMGVYTPRNGNDEDPSRFEQATVSYEEARKGEPFLRQPVRPSAGYALADGTRVSSPRLAALSDNALSSNKDPGE